MIPVISVFSQFSNALLIFLCGVVLLYLLKSIHLKDRLWLASVASILVIVLVSLGQIASYYSMNERLRAREAALDTLKLQYTSLKSSTETARLTYGGAKQDVVSSRKELDEIRSRVDAEFDRTIREIRRVYSDISDEELNRRVDAAVRTAKQNLRKNVFQ